MFHAWGLRSRPSTGRRSGARRVPGPVLRRRAAVGVAEEPGEVRLRDEPPAVGDVDDAVVAARGRGQVAVRLLQTPALDELRDGGALGGEGPVEMPGRDADGPSDGVGAQVEIPEVCVDVDLR